MSVNWGRPANRNQGAGSGTQYQLLPVGKYRFIILQPSVSINERFPNKDGSFPLQFAFPLQVAPPDMQRLLARTKLPEGVTQSNRPTFPYRVGNSLGWWKDGKYNETKLSTFLCAAFGYPTNQEVLNALKDGFGPPINEYDDQETNLATITKWLSALQGLELYGKIRHHTGNRGDIADFCEPEPLGYPGDPSESDEATLKRAKLRFQAWTHQETTPSEKRTESLPDAPQGLSELAATYWHQLQMPSTHERLTSIGQAIIANTSKFAPGETAKLFELGKQRRAELFAQEHDPFQTPADQPPVVRASSGSNASSNTNTLSNSLSNTVLEDEVPEIPDDEEPPRTYDQVFPGEDLVEQELFGGELDKGP